MKVIGIISTVALSMLLGLAAPAYAQQEQQDRQEKPSRTATEQAQAGQAQPAACSSTAVGHKQQQLPHPNSSNKIRTSSKSVPQQEQRDRGENRKQERAQQQDDNKQQQRAQGRTGSKSAPDNSRGETRTIINSAPSNGRGKTTSRGAHRNSSVSSVQQSAWEQHRSQQRWESEHRTWQQRGGHNGYRIPDDRFHGYFGPEHGFRIYGQPFMVVRGYPRFQYGGYWITAVDPWPEYWGNDWYDNDDVYVVYADNGYYLYNRRYPSAGIAISISM
jgi:hypothetical protein